MRQREERRAQAQIGQGDLVQGLDAQALADHLGGRDGAGHAQVLAALLQAQIAALLRPAQEGALAGVAATRRALGDRAVLEEGSVVMDGEQALLAAKAGATFVSPFVGRHDDNGFDGMQLIADIRLIYDNYAYETEILVASVRHGIHVLEAAKIGADVMTAPPSVIKGLFKHILTEKGIEGFLADWAKTGQSI